MMGKGGMKKTTAMNKGHGDEGLRVQMKRTTATLGQRSKKGGEETCLLARLAREKGLRREN